MGSFNGLLDAKFMPPRNWSLDAPLKFKSQTLTKEEREMLVECGVQVTKTTNTIFVHKNTKAHNVYTVNSNNILRNVNAQQLQCFNALPNTIMQRAKTFPTKHAQQLYKQMRNKFVHNK